MARMDERQARSGILRFFDPRLHRIGFGIEIALYNPRERTILVYSKEDVDSSTPLLSVIPLDEIQHLTIGQLCAVAGSVISEALRGGYAVEVGCLCAFQVHLAYFREEENNVSAEEKTSSSVYGVIDELNRLVEFLHIKLSWQEVKDIVWLPLSSTD